MTEGRFPVPWALPFLTATATAAGLLVVQAAGSLVTGRPAFGTGADLALRAVPGLFFGLLAVGVARSLRFGWPPRVRLRLALSALAGGVAALLVESGGGDLESVVDAGDVRSLLTWFLLGPATALIVWPWGEAREAAPPEPSPEQLSRRAWALPFLLAPGLSCGSTLGFSVAAGEELGRDPMGSVLLVLTVLTLAGAFAVSLVTVMLSKALRRPAPRRLGLRLLGSGVLGLALGVLAWHGTYGAAAGLDLTALLLVPAALSWPWRSRRVAAAAAR